jgi:hypothetical protein
MFAHVCAFLCDGEPTMTPGQSYQVMNSPIRVAASGDKENNKSSVALILKVTRPIWLR